MKQRNTQQLLYIALAVALLSCLALCVVGATVLAITRDGEAVQWAFTFYAQLASVVSLSLGGMGVTHMIITRPLGPGSL